MGVQGRGAGRRIHHRHHRLKPVSQHEIGVVDQGVQDRRLFPTRVIQGLQRQVHRRVLGPALAETAAPSRAPLALRLVDKVPLLRRVPARIVGLGVRREHIRSPLR